MMNFGLGCAPSVMDGTEYIASVDDKIHIPSEYDLRNAMPPVRDQGTTSTCVCQSLVSCLDFMRNEDNGTPHKVNGFSVDELYGIRADKNAEGMQIKEALKYIKGHGMDGMRIGSYARVMSDEMLRRCLVMFGPCVGGLPVYSNSPTKFWVPNGRFLGGHCITFVGYNSEGFVIRNSWGTAWGSRGHVILPYNEFSKACFEAWTIAL